MPNFITFRQRLELARRLRAEGNIHLAETVELCGLDNGTECEVCAWLYEMVVEDSVAGS